MAIHLARSPRWFVLCLGVVSLAAAQQPSAVVRQHVWVEVEGLDSDRDGHHDRIHVQIHRPTSTEQGTKLPVILSASPYSGGTMPYPRHSMDVPLFVPGVTPMPPRAAEPPPVPGRTFTGVTDPLREIRASGYEAEFLPRGFIFAYANSLGTGHSTGCPTIGGREENLAIKAVVDWFNGRAKAFDGSGAPVTASWTTGATGMIGTSYDGTLPIGAATLGVEGLRAIVPVAGVSSYYDHRRSHGVVINSFPTQGTDADTLFDNILSRAEPEACAYMRARIVAGMDRTTGDYNAWWDERNYVRAVGPQFKAAVLIAHGLNDFNTKPRHAARLWAALQRQGVPSWIWWHQGGHGDRANQARRDVWRDTLYRFWSHYLSASSGPPPSLPKVVIEREDGRWIDYPSWPVPGATTAELSLLPSMNDTAGQLVTTSASSSTAIERIVDDGGVDAEALAKATTSPHRLLYRTEVLKTPVHLSGVPEISLRVSVSAPAAVLTAMVLDIKADGSVAILSRGWADPQNREALDRTTPVVPGAPLNMTFEFQPHDYIWSPGSRIGLMLLSSDRLFTQRPPAGTTLTVYTGQTRLHLPVVGGVRSLRQALSTSGLAVVETPRQR